MATQEKLKPYSDEEVEAKIAELGLDGWYLEGGWLRRKYNTDGWPQTLMLVNTVGYLCEAAWHHADLAVTWGKLWVKLQTHSSGGITDKDFALARQMEAPPNKFFYSKAPRKPPAGGAPAPFPPRRARGPAPARPAGPRPPAV